ncbi:MAG: HD domain-containing protein [Candidatus Gastranaerophilales bacterium]|nr:HD domain-containing protein [Elusimicrobiota bacterium]MBR6298004.1 HD domain-containing protein [Candidatus Gastranaerophilales bacterium]
MNKIEYFITELDFIDDPKIKEIAQNLIGQLPDYFFEVAASSTGKYHPKYALGKEGLIRHTKAAVRIANDLLRLEMFKGLSEKKDLIITALLLHDGWKHGREYNNYAQSNHPLIAAEMVEELCEDKEIATQLATLIKTHMGQWNTDWKTGVEIMPKPETKIQSFVHLCDYLASRKFLEFNFEV